MGAVLTLSSTVQCGHAGTVGVSGSALLTVGSSAVLTPDGVATKAVAGCTTAPSSPTKPCTTVLSVLPSSQAIKLTAGGMPVLLDSLAGATDGMPPGTLMAVAGQTKLSAV